jgi:hypothetical protein
VAAARKTLDEARARERAAALTWEKEKTISRHLEQQLAAAQEITIPQDDDDDRSVDVGSNPDAALTAHLHACRSLEYTIGGHDHFGTLVTRLQAVARSRASHASSLRPR